MKMRLLLLWLIMPALTMGVRASAQRINPPLTMREKEIIACANKGAFIEKYLQVLHARVDLPNARLESFRYKVIEVETMLDVLDKKAVSEKEIQLARVERKNLSRDVACLQKGTSEKADCMQGLREAQAELKLASDAVLVEYTPCDKYGFN